MSLNHIIDDPSLQKKLKRAGYENLETLISTNLKEVITELKLSEKEVQSLFDIVNTELRERREIKHNKKLYSISTQSKNIDALFGSGIPFKKITEICGEAGSGKTQLCMQLALNSLLPAEGRGEPGECIYIDTEGSFTFQGRLSHILNTEDMDRLHAFHASTYTELTSLILQIPNMLETYPNVKLIIIDSIAYHFRVNVMTKNSRDGILDLIGLTLFRIAKQNNLAIVASNHVTQEESNSTWIPSLGSSWGNWCNNRLFLYRKRNSRFAYLYKSYDPKGSKPAQFCIKSRGITDPVEDELEESIKEEDIREKLDDDINVTFTQLRQEKDEEDEQDRVDTFWKEAYNDPNYINKFADGIYSYSPNSSQQTEQCAQKEPINEEDDLPTYTQTVFKHKIDEELPIQNIDAIQGEEKKEENELFLQEIYDQEEKEHTYEEDDLASQLPIDEDDDVNFLSETRMNSDTVPHVKNESISSSQVNNQAVYEEEDFITGTQVAEVYSYNGSFYQDVNDISFFNETPEISNLIAIETLRSSQSTDKTPSLRASLGIDFPSSTDITESGMNIPSPIESLENIESSPNNEEIIKDSSLIKEYENLIHEVMSQEDTSSQNILSPCKETNDNNQSNSQTSQIKEFDVCPVTNTIPKKEENEESTPHSSQVDSVEKACSIKSELITEDVEIETNSHLNPDNNSNSQQSLVLSSLSSEEKITDDNLSQQQTRIKKRDHDKLEIDEDSDNSSKRLKMNTDMNFSLVSSCNSNNSNLNKEIKIVDQTQNDNTNQTITDTAIVTANNTIKKDKEFVADWDSDVEEELDYQYMNEINEFM